ncbi:hypothetical protein VTK73DRAFT_6781 [Phialemonium thermophilum]|uniref:C-CAP/cofactor C-like domain-containing protein n=1 Tax=Phialemonium thermophilum TaxID=223376 RepID=A0ABR3Y8L2_9PEZI
MDSKECFYRHFQASVNTIQEQINRLADCSAVGGERQDATERIMASISRLSNEVADASEYIPAYDLRTYSQTIKALSEQLNSVVSKWAPRNRFQFKSRASAPFSTTSKHDFRRLGRAQENPTATVSDATSEQRDAVGGLPSEKNYNEEIGRQRGSDNRRPSFSSATDITISDHAGLHIILPSTASRAASAGSLTKLRGCIVDMSGPTTGGALFVSLTVRDVEKSLIVAGRVSGSAHITGVKDSIVVVAARQVRIHECTNVDFYLHCKSHPIIEDCSGLRFAPLPATYATEQEPAEQNQWDKVDDFKWLKAEHSPNWSILPETERLPEDTWRRIAPGLPGMNVNDVLKRVGIEVK